MTDAVENTPISRRKARVARAESGGTLTRADLCEAVHRQIGLARAESSGLVEMVLDHIGDVLVSGENVKISSFGSFVLRNKGQRIGRNPKTGQEVPIEPRTVLTFRPSQLLRERINAGSAAAPARA